MAILFGHYVADAGRIEVFGRPLAPGRPREALAAGIGMVHQRFVLADNLTALENIVLGTEPLWALRSAAGRPGRACSNSPGATACAWSPTGWWGSFPSANSSGSRS